MSRWATLRAPMPLLGKELVEQAARRRTYILRMVCAALLFLIFGAFAYGIFERARYGSARLGHGCQLFDALVYIQFVGILIFQPALMSGVLAAEKENRSLPLLLLTDLRPREVLLQKYVSRLIPMFTILLLSMPLMALAYAFGGMTTTYLLTGIYVLAITCLQVGALALLCSSFCRTSLGAFLSSYLLGALFYLGVPFLMAVMEIAPFRGRAGSFAFATFMPVFLFVAASMGSRFGGLGMPTVGIAALGLQSAGVLVSIVAFLVLARVFLLRRALLAPRNELLLAFRAIDKVFNAINRAVGNVVLVRDRGDLPEDEPIAWREVARKSLGKVRYLFRILVLLEVPVLFVALFCLIVGPPRGEPGFLSFWLIIVWILAALTVTVMSANAIAAERVHQTLDVLLTAPLAGADILRQKLRGVRRLIWVLAIPFASIFLLEAWWRESVGHSVYGYRSYRNWEVWSYLVSSAVLVALYLPMLSWFALWVSLKSRTRFRAILTALMVLVGWVLVPWLAAGLLDAADLHDNVLDEPAGLVLMLSSPATMILVTEFGPPTEVPILLLVALNALGYGGILVVFRPLCLNGASRLLGRAGRPPPLGAARARTGEGPS